MCVFSAPKPPVDNSAALAQQREAARQADIREGRTKIDDAFSRFDDPFFDNIRTSHEDFLFPQIDQQYADATRRLKLKLAGAGTLNSGAGAQNLGRLTENFNLQRTGIANQAFDASNRHRQLVENERSDLYNLNTSSADPAAIAVQAASRAGPLLTPPSASPISNVFADFINNLSFGLQARNKDFSGLTSGLFKPDKSAQRIIG